MGIPWRTSEGRSDLDGCHGVVFTEAVTDNPSQTCHQSDRAIHMGVLALGRQGLRHQDKTTINTDKSARTTRQSINGVQKGLTPGIILKRVQPFNELNVMSCPRTSMISRARLKQCVQVLTKRRTLIH